MGRARLDNALGAGSTLDPPPSRIAIAAAPGAGKTTLARRLAPLVRADAIELDALAHGPNWSMRPEFEAEVDAFTRRDRWITEWQFDQARPVIAERADTLVWLDLPTRLIMFRLVRRIVASRLSREPLWAGNVEPPLWRVLVDPNHMVRWGYRSIALVRQQVAAAVRDYPHLRVVRLRSQADTDAFVRAAASGFVV
jgi:hypothetical protein